MKFSAKIIVERFRTAQEWAKEAFDFARELDWLGDAKQHPEGSEHRELAQVRDNVDHEFNRCCREFVGFRRRRAETTHCRELSSDVVIQTMGDGADALHLMERDQALYGDELDHEGDPGPDTYPDMFAWDTYLRVRKLAKLAEQFPKHIRHSARQMNGWPMIVSPHLDGAHEFRRLAELLELGADFPLDVGPRKRRGTETPLLRYLQPLVWGLHVLNSGWNRSKEVRTEEHFMFFISRFWWPFPKEELTPEMVAVIKLVPSLPPLTQKTAREWSLKVIVPFILIRDAGTLETCKNPALRNIWRHRSVKSRATFRSRLHSAVTDTLQRFGRNEK